MAWWHYIILILPALPNLWAIWHAFNHNFSSPQERLLWVALSVFVPIIGGVIYFFFGRRRTCNEPVKPLDNSLQ